MPSNMPSAIDGDMYKQINFFNRRGGKCYEKKVFSVLLTVALATGVLAGCGSSAATGNNAATGAAQNEGSQTASATTAGEESGDTIVIRSCFATGMTGAVNRFAIEKGLYKELGIEFET